MRFRFDILLFVGCQSMKEAIAISKRESWAAGLPCCILRFALGSILVKTA